MVIWRTPKGEARSDDREATPVREALGGLDFGDSVVNDMSAFNPLTLVRGGQARAAIVFVILMWPSSMAAQGVARCISDVEDVSRTWHQLEDGSERGSQAGPSARRAGPHHAGPHVEYMRNQLRLALRQCQEGNLDEAQLRIALIRSWLKLPEMSK